MSSSPVGFDAAAAGAAPGTPGSRPKLEHAYLLTYEPSKDGSLSQPGPQLDRIDFQFNPKELALTKAASWSRETAKGNKKSSPPQYKGPQPSKLSLEMFFDASAKQDSSVVKTVEKLFACTVPTPSSLQAKKASPPWVIFRWGGLTGFLAYVSSVNAKYTMFTAGGLPIRATCTITLEELAGEAPKQNPSSGGLIPHRVHLVLEGDSLPAIAYREYGKPALWRAVAATNGIDDPMRLRPGTRLLLPALEDLDGSHLGPDDVADRVAAEQAANKLDDLAGGRQPLRSRTGGLADAAAR
ncbi:LysM peptidoglycan-binding domain-containing protein [Nocardioides speluncae]|uniref:CIS tube protein n=1 Tax=Nocardioides speluncae TaxID=2670337 RepID=UPI00197D2DEC|nr:LysM peptidoglycan-binding domain-containing protein [Nocardioides speluncae]